MDKNCIILSTKYLELINIIDSIIYELLYGENEGYTKLSGKDAVVNSAKIMEKFDYEVQKIKQTSEFSDTENIISEKREELFKFIDNFSKKQILVWSEEVFNKLIENLLLSVLINKNNEDEIKKISIRAYSAIEWLSGLKNLSKSEKEKYIKEFNSKAQEIYLSKDEDYISKINPEKSDRTAFLKLRDELIKNDTDEINLEEYKNKLSTEDINYFKRIINELKSFKKTQAKDELMLVNSAILIMKLKTVEEKYEFIKEVDGEITIFLTKNKKIETEEKIEIIKRRMKLFEDSNKRNETSEYFKKLLLSS